MAVAADEQLEETGSWQPSRELRATGQAPQAARAVSAEGLGRRIDLNKQGQEQSHTLRTSICHHAKFGEQQSIVRKGAPGRKTRSLGCYFSGSPQSSVFCEGQLFKFSGQHWLRLLYYATAIA